MNRPGAAPRTAGRRRRAAFRLSLAAPADAAELAAMRAGVGAELERRHGPARGAGPPGERAVRRDIESARVLIARAGGRIVGTLTLQTRKPWAIDVAYFTPVARALYLVNMAVHPAHQGRGIGRACLAEADRLAAALPAMAIRLDAYAPPHPHAVAAGFYARCGYTDRGHAVYRGTPLQYFERVLDPPEALAPRRRSR